MDRCISGAVCCSAQLMQPVRWRNPGGCDGMASVQVYRGRTDLSREHQQRAGPSRQPTSGANVTPEISRTRVVINELRKGEVHV
jgi:hypothetical protein